VALAVSLSAAVEAARMTHDAIVIGGGPAGTTAALLLARAGWSVALVERKSFPRRKVCGEYLSATNLPLFDKLGIGDLFRDLAGTPVRRVGLFAGHAMIESDLPHAGADWGRALAREHLDTWLMNQTRAEGVPIWQPWTVDDLTHDDDIYRCHARSLETGSQTMLQAPIVIAAHGSWEPGRLPTQVFRPTPQSSDLLAFKAHFRNSALPDGLMPLLAFPGGYGGMVHTDGGRVSLSCCVRRDQLTRLRSDDAGNAGEAVLAHIKASCLGVRQALAPATRDGAWLAVGPIRPGIRLRNFGGIFPIGNAAGESHPVIAEGVSMALQSAWLLCGQLIEWRRHSGRRADLDRVARRYAEAWRRAFAPRLHASTILAEWAMRPTLVAGTLPFLGCFPTLMTSIARFTGKTTRVVRQPKVFTAEYAEIAEFHALRSLR
jgi:2-polyprenyl-6-methoxyphenol hydroxylase-like FAD-dependent oxidoreductase